MDWLVKSVEVMTWAGLAFAFVVTYLKVNKVWIRRYDQNVADSISVTAVVLGLAFNTLPYFIQYTFIEPDFTLAVRESIKLIAAMLFFAIGIGYWARRDQRRGIWALIRRAFKLESQEAADLARGFIRPVGAAKIIRILDQVALIDRHYDESEHRFISAFAKTWHLDHEQDLAELKEGSEDKQQDQLYIELRQSVSGYLGLHPPRDQVAHLLDVIRVLVNVDEKTTPEEQFILAEIEGMMNHYLRRKSADHVHSVLVVPQSPEQRQAIHAILPNVELEHRGGGEVFVVDSFYSRVFADMICQKYRDLDFFTTVEMAAAPTDDASAAEP